MTHKQQLSHLALPQRGVIFSRILLLGVAAAATSVVTMVAPRSAGAQVVSPVSPPVVNPTLPSTPNLGGTPVSGTTTTTTTPVSPTVVNPTIPSTPNLGGTPVSGTTTTTTTPVSPTVVNPTTPGTPGGIGGAAVSETTTTTTGQTTTTTTTATGTTTEVGSAATTAATTTAATTTAAPTTAAPTTAATTTAAPTTAAPTTAAPTTAAPTTAAPTAATTAATTTPTTAPTQGTATTQPQPAVTTTATTTVVEQFIFGTTIETVYVRGLAGRLGTSQAVLVQTRVFQVVTGLSGNQTAVLQAFQAALERAGILNLASYNNAAFADLIANSGNAQLAIEVFSRLAVNRLMLLSRLGGLSSLSARQGLVGVRFARVTITQYVVYQSLGTRFITFPRERKK